MLRSDGITAGCRGAGGDTEGATGLNGGIGRPSSRESQAGEVVQTNQHERIRERHRPGSRSGVHNGGDVPPGGRE